MRVSRTYSRRARKDRGVLNLLVSLCVLCGFGVSTYVASAANQASSPESALVSALRWRQVGPQ